MQIEDPFKKLGPLAIFSAKRHWTIQRNVCLKKATRPHIIDSDIVINSSIRSRGSSSASSTASSSSGMSLTQLNRRNNEYAEDYGFKLRGDSPVIISSVKPHSLADVSSVVIMS